MYLRHRCGGSGLVQVDTMVSFPHPGLWSLTGRQLDKHRPRVGRLQTPTTDSHMNTVVSVSCQMPSKMSTLSDTQRKIPGPLPSPATPPPLAMPLARSSSTSPPLLSMRRPDGPMSARSLRAQAAAGAGTIQVIASSLSRPTRRRRSSFNGLHATSQRRVRSLRAPPAVCNLTAPRSIRAPPASRPQREHSMESRGSRPADWDPRT